MSMNTKNGYSVFYLVKKSPEQYAKNINRHKNKKAAKPQKVRKR